MKGEGKELAELALFFTAGTAAGLAADSHLINVLIPISFTAAAVLALCPVISIRSGDREYRFGSGWTPFLLKMSFFFAGLLTASVHSVDGGCIQAWNIFRPLQNAALDSVRGLKSLIDGISAIVLASSLGIGVMFSGVLCFLYEGIITVCARFIGPYLTTSVINEMTCVGSLLIIAVGINMLFKNKIRVMNSIPAVFLPILLCRIM